MAKRTPKASPADVTGYVLVGVATCVVAMLLSLVLSIACLNRSAADRKQLSALQDEAMTLGAVANRTEQRLGAVEDRLNKAVPCPHAKSKNVCKW